MSDGQMGKAVLVVEDEQVLRGALKEVLSKAGYGALEAADGEEGLKTALESRPNLILLDIMMLKMDGLAVLKALRQDAWGQAAPIILLTVLEPDDKITQHIAEDKPACYLVKANWKLEDVVRKVKEAMDMR